MLIGYARVSTDDQNLDLQRDALTQAGCERITEDRLSGAKAERPGLTLALDYGRDGDVVVRWRLDRLSRSLKGFIVMVALLDSKDLSLNSLLEAIDMLCSSRRLIFRIFRALA